ncbi:MAG: HlyD family efflux transporter periplasmic adaptor subunit [Bacteroidetes bacterium]|nr:MAG: HlyD family efflux transporter periplasmic adaptor subunit [Bacteroidota bacterium]
MKRPRLAAARAALLPLLLALAGGLAACNGNDHLSDAYGNFEAPEVVVSAEVSGRLVRFDVEEGQRLAAGAVVGLVDTTQLALQRAQLRAQREAVRSRLRSVRAQIDVLEAQQRVALTEKARLERLLARDAAPRKQYDDVLGQLDVLEAQIASVRTQTATIEAEVAALDVQLDQVADRLARSRIVNPVAGTVLVTYAEAHELAAAGRPLYKIADLDTMELRAYVSGAQLPHLRLGQRVTVLIDDGPTANRTLEGEVTWIASEAEFTPKLIQTKEERVNLVYAFLVRVPNPDGALKIGMPGEVRFTAPTP